MGTIILSIKPKYSNAIFNGKKKFELRKQKPKKEINNIIVYSTSPDRMIIGEVEVIEIIFGTPKEIWKIVKNNAFISKKDYFTYFNKRKIAYAYRLGNVKKYIKPKKIIDLGLQYPPQSFFYINESK